MNGHSHSNGSKTNTADLVWAGWSGNSAVSAAPLDFSALPQLDTSEISFSQVNQNQGDFEQNSISSPPSNSNTGVGPWVYDSIDPSCLTYQQREIVENGSSMRLSAYSAAPSRVDSGQFEEYDPHSNGVSHRSGRTARSRPMKCPYGCGKTFRRKVDVDRHVREQHKCGHVACENLTFRTRKERDQHRALHGEQGIAYRCGSCDLGGNEKIFEREDRIKSHLTKMHHVRGGFAFQQYQCPDPLCRGGIEGGVFFASAANLEEHRALKHPGGVDKWLLEGVDGFEDCSMIGPGQDIFVPTLGDSTDLVEHSHLLDSGALGYATPDHESRSLSETLDLLIEQMYTSGKDPWKDFTSAQYVDWEIQEITVGDMEMRTLGNVYSDKKFFDVVNALNQHKIRAVFIRSESMVKLRGAVSPRIMQQAMMMLQTFAQYVLHQVEFTTIKVSPQSRKTLRSRPLHRTASPKVYPLLPSRAEDAEAIETWRYVLPEIREIVRRPKFGDSYGVSLVRQRGNRDLEEPVIRFLSSSAMTKKAREDIEERLQKKCASVNRSWIQLVWATGEKVPLAGDRTHNDQSFGSEPPLNVSGLHRERYYKYPGIGASIGMSHCDHVLATLGGYISVQGSQYVLTADHLARVAETCTEDNCTQQAMSTNEVCSPARANSAEQATIIAKLLSDLGEDLDRPPRPTTDSSAWSDEISLNPTMEGLIRDERDIVRYIEHYRRLRDDLEPPPEELKFGECEVRSNSDLWRPIYAVEKSSVINHCMDWALIRVSPHRQGKNMLRYEETIDVEPSLEQLDQEISEENTKYGTGPSCQSIRSFETAETVFYIGAHSGYQEGVIGAQPLECTHPDDCVTQEWFIVPSSKRVLDAEDVGGDSGAWVLAKTDKMVIGLLWGYYDGNLLFTPIKEVIASIEKKMNQRGKVRIVPVDEDRGRRAAIQINGSRGSLSIRKPYRVIQNIRQTFEPSESPARPNPFILSEKSFKSDEDSDLDILTLNSSASSIGSSSPVPSLSSSVSSLSNFTSRATSPETSRPAPLDLLGSLSKLGVQSECIPKNAQEALVIDDEFPTQILERNATLVS